MGWGQRSTPSRPILALTGGEVSAERQRLLLHGLVGDEWTLYYRSATFHATVDHLVELLPRWLEGIAAESAAEVAALAHATIDRAAGAPGVDPIPRPTVGPALLARLALHEVER